MRQSASWFLIILLLACGPARPVPQKTPVSLPPDEPLPAPSLELEPLIDLGLRIIPEGNYADSLHNYKVPDPNIDVRSVALEAGVKIKKSQISYSKAIELPDIHSDDWNKRRELFFVWPENLSGNDIVHTIVTHQILDGENKIVGSLKPTVAWHDLEKRRWFFPITHLFKESKYNKGSKISAAETQIMSLELTLQNGQKNSFEVRFRVKGRIYETK